MKIKVLLFMIIFVFSAVIGLNKAYAETQTWDEWIKSCLEEECSQEDFYYLKGILSLSKKNRGNLSPAKFYLRTDGDVRQVMTDLEELGTWKDVAWYYFVDMEELETYVTGEKLSDGILTWKDIEEQREQKEIETNKDKRRIFLYVGSNKAIVNDTEKVIDEENPETTVFVENDRSYLPVRFLCEEYGGTVEWVEETQTVNVLIKEHKITFTIGNTAIIVDGENIENDVAPILRNGRAFLPLRGLVDAIGKYVIYNSGLIVIDDNQDMVWPMKNMEFVEGFSKERFGMFNAN